MLSSIRTALELAESGAPATDLDPAEAKRALRALADECRRLNDALTATRGALVAVHDDGREMADRLDASAAWGGWG